MSSWFTFPLISIKTTEKAVHQYVIKCSLGETKRIWPMELIDKNSCGLMEIREAEGVWPKSPACMSLLSSLVFFVGLLRVGIGQLLTPLPTYRTPFILEGCIFDLMICTWCYSIICHVWWMLLGACFFSEGRWRRHRTGGLGRWRFGEDVQDLTYEIIIMIIIVIKINI